MKNRPNLSVWISRLLMFYSLCMAMPGQDRDAKPPDQILIRAGSNGPASKKDLSVAKWLTPLDSSTGNRLITGKLK